VFKKEAVVEDIKDGKVILSLSRDKMCSCCSDMFCGGSKENYISVKDHLGLNKGDRVEVGLDSRIITGLNLLIFLIPSVIFILTIFVLKDFDVLLSLGCGIMGVVVYFLLIKFIIINRVKNRLSCRIIGRVT